MKKSNVLTVAAVTLLSIAFFAGRKSAPPEPEHRAVGSVAQGEGTAETRAQAPRVVARGSSDTGATGDGMSTDTRLASVHNEADLGHYLDDLDADARRDGKVTDQLARGAVAGKRLESSLGIPRTAMLMRDFGRRIDRTKTELELKPTTDALAALAQQIRSTPDEGTRRSLVGRYTAMSATLPPLYRLSAMDRLRESDPTAMR